MQHHLSIKNVFVLMLIFNSSCMNTNRHDNLMKVVMPTLNSSLMLSDAYTVQITNDSSVMICLEESIGTRYPQCFSIQKINESISNENQAYLILQNQTYFYYNIGSFEGGSGGKEEHLTGYVTIRGIVFKIASNVQGASKKLDSKWFFPIMETLKIE